MEVMTAVRERRQEMEVMTAVRERRQEMEVVTAAGLGRELSGRSASLGQDNYPPQELSAGDPCSKYRQAKGFQQQQHHCDHKHVDQQELINQDSWNSLPEQIDLDFELSVLEDEGQALRKQQRSAFRATETPTAEMYAECQELLQMFGLPFIVAPVEVNLEAVSHHHSAA